ncbi:Z1 domain-containing protein [Corynebacterium sp. CCUG 69979]|uniref:Z1 domain-containing protein n=1 Tax=Corynebacterium sp. CCUG 69979 TaxID=2823890 RepID=UPI00210F1B0C|nr:Z1 domain-containing protein [Corynebacterium sp. CCUG 69979]
MNEKFDQIRDEIAYALNPSELRLNRSLQDRLSTEGLELTTAELAQFLVEGSGSHVQPLINFILEAQQAEPQALRPRTETTADTPERLEWIIAQLGLIDVAEQVKSRLPDPEPAVIVDERFEPWYTPEREHAVNHYWNDYRRVLERNGWNAESIATVQDQAREVMKRIEDPTAEHYVSTRGLVVGYVQSGKTANFTAVAAKAIDAGYRLIIVLAGTLDNLRNQTQRRLDKELFGREAVLAGRTEDEMTERERRAEAYFNGDEEWDRAWHEDGGAFVHHGTRYGLTGFPRIKRLTTSVDDYRGRGTNPLEVTVPDQNKPVHHPDNLDNMPCMVAVVKKNATVLKQLNSDLKRANGINGAIADLPALIIDDESDQASINTKNNSKKDANEERERTAVNAEITNLMKNCPRAQYVGYTATPFANVFVDPSDPEDLYPRHYVLMLNQPPAYRGARWFHDRADYQDNPSEATIENSNSKAFIRDIAEEAETDPDAFRDVRRDELQQALDMFVLTGAIKKYREAHAPGLKFKHHTMLVHERVGTDAHADAKDTLDDLWNSRKYNLGRPILELQRLFEHDLLPVMEIDYYNAGTPYPKTYAELHPYINEAYEAITRNLSKDKTPFLQVDTQGGDTPDFETGKVWKVLVGGAKLSRGYTVEGLTISYFRRRAGGADTLMQTGRWFGFRKGYQDLVRLYAPPSLVEMFEAAMNDEDVFRRNIKSYKELDDTDRPKLTPMQLAPLVRQSLSDLKPTSKNKMFNAVMLKSASAPEVVDLVTIPDRDRPEDLTANFRDVAIPLLQTVSGGPRELPWLKIVDAGLEEERIHSMGTTDLLVGKVSAEEFVDLLDKMRWYDGAAFKENVVNPRIAYMKDLLGTGKHVDPATSDFSEVAVYVPTVKQAAADLEAYPYALDIDGLNVRVPLVERSRRPGRHDVSGTPHRFRYVIENTADGNLASALKPEDVIKFNLRDVEEKKFGHLEEPEILLEGNERARGAVLVTIFDDRERDVVRKMKQTNTWTPPRWEDGEVGVALTINSPHAPTSAGKNVIEWGVLIPEKDGSVPVTVDSTEVPDTAQHIN